jgi:ABC-type polysaccharide transport system permease subunit
MQEFHPRLPRKISMSQTQSTNESSSPKQLQFELARRIVMYWCITWLIVFSLPIMIRIVTEQVPFDQLARSIMADFWFPIVVSFLVLPVIVCDSIRFARRMSAPA